MAGHSQFKNIMYRKGAQDAKRSRLFSRLAREIMVAARAGADPDANVRLKSAIAAAKSANMPKENIERAIRRATGEGDGAKYEEVRYEGFGPGGVAIIVEAVTDNRNRTAAEIRAAFSKYGGSLGETNSVTYMFDRVGTIHFPPEAGSPDDVFEASLEAGADDVVSDEQGHEVVCSPESFHAVRDALLARLGPPDEAGVVWRPQSTVTVSGSKAEGLFKLLSVLEESDDVQSVSSNFEISNELMERLSA